MARVIFHYPRPVPDAPRSGSEVRVAAMLGAFRSIGADVVLVDGFGRERVREMRRIARAVRAGDRFDAVYGEFTTMPILLSDSHHLPTHPLADFAFLRQLRSSGAGVGVFYRDVHWQFLPYRQQLSARKRWPALAAYRAEAAALPRVVDTLFVPTTRMADHIPGWREHPRLVALPPGCAIRDLPWAPVDRLRLLYVGSVRPPVYDVEPLLRAVDANERVSITVCRREDEASIVAAWSAHPRVNVVHAHGEGLVDLYRHSDASCVVFPAHPYRDFMVPVKLFESIGMGRPILGAEHDMAGKYVLEHELGWAPPIGELGQTIDRLVRHPGEVLRFRERVVAAQPHHTWEARCEFVLDTLVRGRARAGTVGASNATLP